ncbi:MAG: hypothetical protein AAFR36_23540, partial [Bacteroidota bacterium]
DEEAVRRFIIYRARGDEPFRSYTSVTPEESGGTVGRRKRSRRRFSFADTSLKMNTDYRYSVKVLWHDGGQSPLSDALIVNY